LLGNFQLQKIRDEDVQKRLIAPMIEVGLAARTIISYHGAFYTMMEDAYKRKMIARKPNENIVLPEIKSVERPILNMEQVDLFLAELEGHWLAPIAELAVYTAMREGELLALKWEHVDFEGMSLAVRSTVAWITGEGFVVGPPKTDSGERRIDLPECAIDLLQRIRTEQKALRLKKGLAWNKLGLVFPHHEHGGYRHETTVNRVVRKIVAKLCLSENFTFHCFRHTAVALLIKEGAHPKEIQEICGHKSIGMTMDLYGHLFPSIHRETMRRLNSAFSRARARKKA
jgi:integrase